MRSAASPELRDAVRDLAREGDPAIRSQAVSTLVHDDSREAAELLAASLRDEDESIASSALNALRSRGSSADADVIAQLLDDLPEDGGGYGGFRYRVANALKAIGGPATRERVDVIEEILHPESAELHDDMGLGRGGGW